MTRPQQLIRDRLRRELDRQHLTAMELARQAGVKTTFIYDILNGKSAHPSTITLARVAECLGVDLAYLSGAGEPRETEVLILPQVQFLPGNRNPVRDKKAKPYVASRAWLQDGMGVAPEDALIVRIGNTAMAPAFMEGDIVLVDSSQKAPAAGEIVIVLKEGRVQPMPAGSKKRAGTRILGRAVWLGRAL